MATFDLLRGDAEYKSRFGPGVASSFRLQIARTRAGIGVLSGVDSVRRVARVPGTLLSRMHASSQPRGAAMQVRMGVDTVIALERLWEYCFSWRKLNIGPTDLVLDVEAATSPGSG